MRNTKVRPSVINYVETECPGVMAQSLTQWHSESNLDYYVKSFDTCQGKLKAIITVVFEKDSGSVTDVYARYYV